MKTLFFVYLTARGTKADERVIQLIKEMNTATVTTATGWRLDLVGDFNVAPDVMYPVTQNMSVLIPMGNPPEGVVPQVTGVCEFGGSEIIDDPEVVRYFEPLLEQAHKEWLEKKARMENDAKHPLLNVLLDINQTLKDLVYSQEGTTKEGRELGERLCANLARKLRGEDSSVPTPAHINKLKEMFK